MDEGKTRRHDPSEGEETSRQDHLDSHEAAPNAAHQHGARHAPRVGLRDATLHRCVVCGAYVRRSLCHRNRYGEHICNTCQGQGKRWSRRRTAERILRHELSKVLFYGGLGIAGIAVAYVILSKAFQVVAFFAR